MKWAGKRRLVTVVFFHLKKIINPAASSYEIAAAYALLDERERANEWLRIAEKSRANNFQFATVDARFEKIRR